MTAARLAVLAAAAAACHDADNQRSAPRDAGRSDAAAVDAAGARAAASEPAVQRGPPRVIVMEEPPIALPHQESFRLLDAGKGARSVLRYTLAAGDTAVIAHTALSSRHLDNGAFTAPAALPAIRDGFTVTIAGAPRGRLALRAVPGQAAAASREAEAYLAAGRALQDRAITLDVDDRGAIAAFHFDDDPDAAHSGSARDELAQRLLSLIVPVPVEPVGLGASWRVVTILRQGPTAAKQTATYTLTARTPRRWKLHLKLQRVAENQAIADPSLPRGAAAELLALFRQLEGDVEVDPRLPLVAAGGLAVESRVHARIQSPPAGAGSQAAVATVEQMFEDTGRVSFTRCRPPAARAGSAAPAPSEPPGTLADCPPGFLRQP